MDPKVKTVCVGPWVFLLLVMVWELGEIHCKVVKTNLGTMVGSEYDVPEVGIIYSFLKIPYALPPIGPLRFKKPEPFGVWSSILDATEFGASCMQPLSGIPPDLSNQDMSEECLYLNIFVPYKLDIKSPRSVMVWIHGEDYMSGQASTYDGTYLSLSGNVIVVTVNYRLGVLGFLSTGDDVIPGNYGLWDQRLALQWVHDNIASFGGDPYSVTIFGKSAGGGSVSFQSLYPGNQGLFQRVICQSGVATSLYLRDDQSKVRRRAEKYLERLNCPLGNGTELLDCLRTVPAADVIEVLNGVSFSDSFMPVIDGDFITGYAEDILESETSDAYKFFSSLDLMVGTLDGDGTSEFSTFITIEVIKQYKLNLEEGVSTEFLCQYLSPIMSKLALSKYHNEMLAEQLCELYRKLSSTKAQANSVIDLLTDMGTTFPSLEIADYHYVRLPCRNSSKTFVYFMNRVSKRQNLFFPEWTYPWLQRAAHAVDFMYLFAPDVFFVGADSDIILGNRMQMYWTNFAKNGDPNSHDLPFWPQYDHTGRIQVLDLEISHKSKEELFGKRLEFWMDKVHHREVTKATNLGMIMGTSDRISGLGSIYKFRNIPYAKPPTGELRFSKPVPFGSWKGVLDATSFGPRCMETDSADEREMSNLPISEDCLQLNIYVPYDINDYAKRSVIIWVHGESFDSGSGTLYDGTLLSLRGDVIVVTINYRLGIFGFFSTFDSASAGNYGLWDQHMAFKWVHENIEAFGGDPASVTICGSSVGGLFVTLQSFYLGNKGLFQRVISQDGVGLLKLIVSKDQNASRLKSYLSDFGCSKRNTTKVLQCLRAFPAAALVKSESFIPVVDNEFILSNLIYHARETNTSVPDLFSSVDYMVGLSTGDRLNTLQELISRLAFSKYKKTFNNEMNSEYTCNNIAKSIVEQWYRDNSKVRTEICRLYSNETSLEAKQQARYNLLSDIFYKYPAVKTANLHQKNAVGNTFMYIIGRMDNRHQFLLSRRNHTLKSLPSNELDVLRIIYPPQLLEVKKTEDYERTIQLIKYWSNFAKNGNPNGEDLPYWPEYGSQNVVQVLDKTTISENLNMSERLAFWLERVPGYMSEKYTTMDGPSSLSPYNTVDGPSSLSPYNIVDGPTSSSPYNTVDRHTSSSPYITFWHVNLSLTFCLLFLF